MANSHNEQTIFVRPQDIVFALETILDDVDGVTAGSHFRRRLVMEEISWFDQIDA